ncbi:MAG: TauD/TfdA family dioxygenase [Alphaproteobacteria bacterium]|jgi:alpha-ketoglutarate-dependent 2,4-dichlorophenoxyacetate dioxygenase|nr:TauD/TfdA family dioxygenase [Alphaproteobacteria bacterium]
MALELTELHDDFGAEIAGIDLANGIGDALFEEIELAFNCYSVLVLRGQTLDDDSQIEFSRRFGPLEIATPTYANTGEVTPIGRVSNVDADGNKLPADHTRVKYLTGNLMWHSDSSFKETPALASLLSAREVPPEGGDTEFVSQRAAYARLPDNLKAKIDDLVVIHDFVFSRGKISEDAVTPEHEKLVPPVEQRLVRTNPMTGEKNYFVGSHAHLIAGWPEAESRALIEDLIQRAVRPEDIYLHRWQPGDLVIWDNRCVLHRGRPFDADKYRRVLHRTTVAGAGPSLVAG